MHAGLDHPDDIGQALRKLSHMAHAFDQTPCWEAHGPVTLYLARDLQDLLCGPRNSTEIKRPCISSHSDLAGAHEINRCST
jgi:hypothetical protein